MPACVALEQVMYAELLSIGEELLVLNPSFVQWHGAAGVLDTSAGLHAEVCASC